MPITLDQIVEETREMPAEVVAELIDRIMVARHGGIEPSVAESWKTEIDRRIAEIESGKVKGVPLEESLARARKIAGQLETWDRRRACLHFNFFTFYTGDFSQL
jgi:putative addiction module component (TIGR02574 family)